MIRAGLSVAALALIAVPIFVALRFHEAGLEIAPQSIMTPAVVSSQDAARWRSVGLAYHDIRLAKRGFGRASSGYNVTPQHLDLQLTVLHDAGYRSVTAAQYTAYLKGGAVPSRSVLITFDGATQGLWIYADQILARHHMHGVALLNPHTIETYWTRELSWPEIHRMQATGRWDFGAALSARTVNDRAGTAAKRIAAALRESTEVFERQLGVEPRLLAWPTTAPGLAPRPEGPVDAARVIQLPFAAAFASGENLAPPTSRRAAAGKLMSRVQVTRTTEPDQLLESVASSTAIPVAGVHVLADTGRWAVGVDDPAPVVMSGNTIRFTGPGRHAEATFAANDTADWDDYVVDATVRNLTASRTNSASIIVRVGSTRELTVRVGARSAMVIDTHAATRAVLRRSLLFPATVHHLHVVVRPAVTRVTIDHLVRLVVPATGGIRSAGGIGLASFRRSAGAGWPTFSELTVVPASRASIRSDHVTPISVHAPAPLERSSLWVRSRFAPAAIRATADTLRFTSGKLRAFAEYAPGQTAHWSGYAFGATAENLLPGESVGVYGRLRSPSQALAIVGQHWIRVFSGPLNFRKLVVSRALPNSTSHRITLRVFSRTTAVQVDSVTVASVPAQRGAAGGVGLAAKRTLGQAWPRFVGLRLTALR
jgi:biofilm PGA synthesis lipoprotein PgaB